jgi:hypothetical protein
MIFLTESLITGRGAVVAFFLMTRLTTEAYATAFYAFLDQNTSTWYICREKNCIVLQFVMVLDHADSQRKGFIEAVRMLHVAKQLEAPWTPELAQSYYENLQGCEFHWAASVKNTAHNGNIIAAPKTLEFKHYCKQLLEATTMESFNATSNKIRAHFPKATTWLKWWINPLHAVLLFPAFRASMLHQDLQAFAKNPKTTNICESQHRNYYRYLKKLNLPLVLACVNGFHYCTQQVADAEAVATGSRPLTGRDKSAIMRKTAVFARHMEFDNGIRPPTKTSEHNIDKEHAGRGKKAKTGSEVPSETHVAMRLNIVAGKSALSSVLTSHVRQHQNTSPFYFD